MTWKTVLALVLCLHQSASQSSGPQTTLCDILNDTRSDVEAIFEQTGFNETRAAEELGWENYVAENTGVLNRICDLLALQGLAKHVQGTDGVDLGVLLGQVVHHACNWLYGSSYPDGDCEVSLRYFCFRKRTHYFAMNSFVDNATDKDKKCRV